MSLRLAPVVLAVAMMVVEDIFGWRNRTDYGLTCSHELVLRVCSFGTY
jgi:hypothetical protein